MFHVERRASGFTDTVKLMVAFRSFAKRLHIKILGNARVVTVYCTGACCIIWKRHLLINIADVSTRIYKMLQYAELFARFVACYAIWRHLTHTANCLA
jgi:hypothetical protein